jgi:hypothetical protein
LDARYNGYMIALVEFEPGRWRAHISFEDGSMIRVGHRELDTVQTSVVQQSAKAALEQAKREIDAGGYPPA